MKLLDSPLIGRLRDANHGLLAMAMAIALLSASCSEILSPDISNTTITVNSPVDSLYTAETAISFWWEKDTDIEQYQLRITTAGSGNVTLLADTTLAANTVSYTFSQDNAYRWQLRGVNEGSETAWQEGLFFTDYTSPDKATALHLDGDTIATGATDSLQWYSVDYPIAGVTYPVADSLLLYRKNDSVTVGARYYFGIQAARSIAISATAPTPLNGPGKYYWKVVTIDNAGNRKQSDQFQFVVQ
jgi:hypothetical protein